MTTIQTGPVESYTDARRTIAGLVACALAVLPLRGLFTDWAWLVDTWVVMAIALLPAAALRLRSQPRVWHLLPGLILVVFYLTHRYVPEHAFAGIIPGPGAWQDVAILDGQVRDSIRDEVAPLESTVAIQMVLAAQAALFAVAIDLLAIVARRPALAGIPFLVIVTVAGAVPRHAVGLVWFALAAAGYLLLLASDRRDELVRWGRVMPRTTSNRATAVQALSGRRIGVIAIVAALCIPFILPIRGGNVVADALHNGGGGTGDGPGSGSGVALDPLAALKGQLTLKTPIQLLTVQYEGDSQHDPFYLRQEVLDSYNGSAWTRSDDSSNLQTLDTNLTSAPPTVGTRIDYQATITTNVTLQGNAPIFATPTVVGGLSGGAWNPVNLLAVDSKVPKGTTYQETVSEPIPSDADLTGSGEALPPDQVARLTQTQKVPAQVRTLVDQIIGKATTSYDKAKAIFGYFVNPASGFGYSLQTKGGTSGSDLVDFLNNKVGYCQQYAAAMGVMLRLVGVPTRVVIGYTHRSPDADGRFPVTSYDAHAWVEAYFPAAGWVPFDPTPLAGADAQRASALSWAPHPGQTIAPSENTTAPRISLSGGPTAAQAASANSGSASGTSGGPGWVVWLVVALAVLIAILTLLPAAVRVKRRRARLRSGRAGPDPLWAELADTAVDLGYVWSPVRSPRQVEGWLRHEGVAGADAEGALHSLAVAVERSRYAPPGGTATATDLVADLREVEASLRACRGRRERVRARILPASVSWLRRALHRH